MQCGHYFPEKNYNQNFRRAREIYVTSFFSITKYSNVRLISKMYLEQNSRSITLDIHASTVEHPPHLFRFKPHRHSANKVSV